MLQKHERMHEELKQMHREMMDMGGSVHAKIATIKKGDPGLPGRGEKGDPGKDANPDKIAELVMGRIKLPANGKDGHHGRDGKSVKAEEVIEELKRKKAIRAEHISGLTEHIGEIRNAVMRGGQGSWKIKNLSGSINSSNKIFTCSGDKPADNSHHVYLNYLEQNPLADYTLTYANGTITVTYATAPDTSLSGQPHYIRFM